jgi:hypothetical protein
MRADPTDPRLQPMAYIHDGRDGQKGRLAEVLAIVPGKVTVEYCDTLEVVPVAPWQVTRDWTLVRAAPRGELRRSQLFAREPKAAA